MFLSDTLSFQLLRITFQAGIEFEFYQLMLHMLEWIPQYQKCYNCVHTWGLNGTGFVMNYEQTRRERQRSCALQEEWIKCQNNADVIKSFKHNLRLRKGMSTWVIPQ